jgi:hypothetical protein
VTPLNSLVEDMARAIHVARFQSPGRERMPEPMDLSDTEYCQRLATAALALCAAALRARAPSESIK